MAKKSNNNTPRITEKAPAKVGPPFAYTPEGLYAKFEEYKEWVKENPRSLYKASQDGKSDTKVYRPLTLIGFCQYAGIVTNTFRGYERKDELFRLQCARVREAIETDQLEGAMVGQYAQSIVARVLKLADRTEVVNKSEVDRISEMTDEELQAEINELSAI